MFHLDYIVYKWDFLNMPWYGSQAKDNFGQNTVEYKR